MSEKSWYSVEAGNGVAAREFNRKIHDTFFEVGATKGNLDSMAAFSIYDLKTNIEIIYFTPAAHSIAQKFNAATCEKPSGDDLQLACGDFRCWQTFFPERIQRAIQRRRTVEN